MDFFLAKYENDLFCIKNLKYFLSFQIPISTLRQTIYWDSHTTFWRFSLKFSLFARTEMLGNDVFYLFLISTWWRLLLCLDITANIFKSFTLCRLFEMLLRRITLCMISKVNPKSFINNAECLSKLMYRHFDIPLHKMIDRNKKIGNHCNNRKSDCPRSAARKFHLWSGEVAPECKIGKVEKSICRKIDSFFAQVPVIQFIPRIASRFVMLMPSERFVGFHNNFWFLFSFSARGKVKEGADWTSKWNENEKNGIRK